MSEVKLKDKGLILYLSESIPFLETTTRKDFNAAILYPRYEAQSYEPIFLSQEEYQKILNQVLKNM